jgi:hypothetical protein
VDEIIMNLRFGMLCISLLLAGLACAAPLPQHSYFVPNLGQWDGAFAFRYSRGSATYFLTETGMSLDLREAVPRCGDYVDEKMDMAGHVPTRPKQDVHGHVLRLSYVNANPNPEIIGEELLSHYSNYFLSRDSCKWRGQVPHYQRVSAKEVWPGIDVEYRASEQGIETVYHVKPFADASQIQLNYEGQNGAIAIDANSRLHLQTSLGPVIEETPFAYQMQSHLQSQVPVQYYLLSDHSYGFVLGNHDPSQEVVIDPLLYSTYVPGELTDFTVDRDGNKIVCGITHSGSLPTTPGAYQETSPEGSTAGYVTKLNPTGTEYVFSTYFRGAGPYSAVMRTDPLGTIFLFCDAENDLWPFTPDAFDTTPGGLNDLGLARFSSDGSTLLFSSLLGGSGSEQNPVIEIDSLGRVYMMGATNSIDFPVTPNAWYPTSQGHDNIFITIFDPSTSTLLESTYFGGESYSRFVSASMAVTSPGLLWIITDAVEPGLPTTPDALQPSFPAGNQLFANYFAWIDMNIHQVRYASYLDAVNVEQDVRIYDIIPIDSTSILLGGTADRGGLSFPLHGYDPNYNSGKIFLLKLELPNTILCGTYFGGTSGYSGARPILIEPSGAILFTGATTSDNYPTTLDAYDRTHHNDHDPDLTPADAILTRLSSNLDSLLYSTYIGAYHEDYAEGMYYDAPDHVWIAGTTNSLDFPVTNDALWSQPFGSFLLHFELPPTSDAVIPVIPQPSSFSLSCYPNPFNPSTRVSFILPKAEYVDLNVYDVTGRLVRRLAGGQMGPPLQAGDHEVVFDGGELPSGIYFARLQTGEVSQTRKMVLLK